MDFLKEYWPVFAAVVSVGIWLVRLEGRVNTIDTMRKADRLAAEKARTEDLQAAKEARENTTSKLEKMETQIGDRFDRVDRKIESAFSEVRSDIKDLIEKVAARPSRAPRRSSTK